MHDARSAPEARDGGGPLAGRGRRVMLLRLLPVAVIAAGFAAFWLLGLDDYVTFETIAAYREELKAWVARDWPLAALSFVAAYVTMVAVGVPGAAVATITAGVLFGTWAGALLSGLAATIGATVVFLAARLAVGDALLRRAGPAVRRMEAGFRRNALSYLLVLRLIPLFPFWLVNIVPAFLNVPLRIYVLGTLLGVLPGSLVFAGLGNGLSHVLAGGEPPGPEVLLAPKVLLPLLALAVLALLPVAWREWRRRRRGDADV